jgi:hypothetical protein
VLLLTAARASPVLLLLILISAPGITAPLLSVMVPCKVAVAVIWADRLEKLRHRSAGTEMKNEIRFRMTPTFRIYGEPIQLAKRRNLVGKTKPVLRNRVSFSVCLRHDSCQLLCGGCRGVLGRHATGSPRARPCI